MKKQAKHFYEFGENRLDLSRRKFHQGDTLVALTPRIFDLLVVFVQRHGQVLEKGYLLDEVWSDVVVEEHSLTQAVSVLRKVLKDKPNDHQYIVTITGRGYQFIASVTEVFEAEDAQPVLVANEFEPAAVQPELRIQPGGGMTAPKVLRPDIARLVRYLIRTVATKRKIAASFLLIGLLAGVLGTWVSSKASRFSSRPAIRSIAVKPFQAVDKESCKTGLSGALTNALVTKLSRVDQLTVIALEHVCDHKPDPSKPRQGSNDPNGSVVRDFGGRIHQGPGTQAVLEGDIQKLGEKFVVTVRLVSAANGASLWAEQFEASESGAREIQNLISEQVISQVALVQNIN